MVRVQKTIGATGIIGAVAALAVVSAACGGGSAATSPSPTPQAAAATLAPPPTNGPAPADTENEQTVAVSLTEWKISGAGGSALGPLKAGEVKFNVSNDGTTQHEFVLIKTDSDQSALPLNGVEVNEDAAGVSPGEADDIEAGQSKTATMRLEPGRYVFICNVPGHYQTGMRGELTVQ
jgi:uncharacterized cupredoxin-like copper-binding protein